MLSYFYLFIFYFLFSKNFLLFANLLDFKITKNIFNHQIFSKKNLFFSELYFLTYFSIFGELQLQRETKLQQKS